MASSYNGPSGSVEKTLLNTLSREQRQSFLSLAQSTEKNRLIEGSLLGKPQKMGNQSEESSDDIIIISSDDDSDIELMDFSSEVSSSSVTKVVTESTESKSPELEIVPPSSVSAEQDELSLKVSVHSNGVQAVSEESSGGEEEDVESDWEVITIDDDDEKPRKAPKDMICLRCPNKRHGTFKDERKYWVHSKRHVLPDHFSCPTCQRPFVRLSYCLSHELRVHNTPLPYDIKDPVISYAKAYIKNQNKRDKENGAPSGQNETAQTDSDMEDATFYRDRVIPSTMIYQYKGPDVTSMLDTYEIQCFNSRPKSSRANAVAKIAIDVHKQNVRKKQDVDRLGRFSGKKGARSMKTAPTCAKPKTKTAVARNNKQTSRVPEKRPREEVVPEAEKIEKDKPKKKRVRYEFIESSSSSPDSESEEQNDSDYIPAESKKKKSDDKAVAGPSGTQRSTSSKLPKKQKVNRYVDPLLKRECLLCKFNWDTQEGLREHRNTAHPNLLLIDLIAYTLPERKSSDKPKAAEKVKKQSNVKKEESKKKETKKKEPAKRNRKKEPPVGAKEPTKKKAVRKARSKSAVKRRPVVPVPDSTFSEKEKFLNYFELTNNVRLHLHQKKDIKALNLPECSVVLERLSDAEIAYHQVASSLRNFPPHFLSL